MAILFHGNAEMSRAGDCAGIAEMGRFFQSPVGTTKLPADAA
jgi:hypothetical protein